MSFCKWGTSFSDRFCVPSGVRQGGVLSPLIFNVYMDDLVGDLRSSGVGCHILDVFIAAILYADDLCLLAPTRSSMQCLLDICQSYAKYWCIAYNTKKTKCMLFGKEHGRLEPVPMVLDTGNLSFVGTYKYLGVTVKAGKTFSCCPRASNCSFYRSANTILNATHGPSEVVQLRLLYSVCVPVLAYAAEVKVFSAREMIRLNTAVNDCIRRVFGFNRWESVRSLRMGHGYPSMTEMFHSRVSSFETTLTSIGNRILAFLYNNV